MNCWHCDTELIWGGDHMFEDFGMDGEGIVTNLSCPQCEAYVEVFLDLTSVSHAGNPTPEENDEEENI